MHPAPVRHLRGQARPARPRPPEPQARRIFRHLGLACHPPCEISFKQVRLVNPRFPTETLKNEPEKMPLPTHSSPPRTEVSKTPLETPWKSRTSEGGPRSTLARLKGIETHAAAVSRQEFGFPQYPCPLKGH